MLRIFLLILLLSVQPAWGHFYPYIGEHRHYYYDNNDEVIAHAQNDPVEFWKYANLEEAKLIAESSVNIDYDKALSGRLIHYYHKNDYSNTEYAIQGDKVLPWLVKQGANVNQIVRFNNYGQEMDDHLIELVELSTELFLLFLDRLDDVNMTYLDGDSLLAGQFHLSGLNEEEIYKRVKALLDKGADINKTITKYIVGTPLMHAVYAGTKQKFYPDYFYKDYNHSIEMIKLLLDYGADIHITNSNGHTAWDMFRCLSDRYIFEHRKGIKQLEELIKPANIRPLAALNCRKNPIEIWDFRKEARY